MTSCLEISVIWAVVVSGEVCDGAVVRSSLVC